MFAGIPALTKKCSRCNVAKELRKFYEDRAECIDCKNKYEKERYALTREKRIAQMKARIERLKQK